MSTRRQFLQQTATAAAASGAGFLLSRATRAAEPKKGPTSDWPVMRGDALATGVAPNSLPAKLQVLWKYSVEGGAFDVTPAVVAGVVYIGDLDGRVLAISLADGKE